MLSVVSCSNWHHNEMTTNLSFLAAAFVADNLCLVALRPSQQFFSHVGTFSCLPRLRLDSSIYNLEFATQCYIITSGAGSLPSLW